MTAIESIASFFEYIVILPAAFLCLYPLRRHLRFSGKKTILLCILVVMASVSITKYIGILYPGIDLNLIFVSFFVVYFIFYAKCITVSYFKAFYVYMTCIAFFSFSSMVNYMVECKLFPTGTSTDITTYGLVVQWLLIILIVVIALRSRTMEWLIDNFHDNSVWKFIWVIPTPFFIANLIMVPRYYANMRVGRIYAIYCIVTCIFLFLLLLFNYMFFRIAQSSLQTAELEKKAQIIEMQENQYEAMKSHMDKTRRLRHDFKHILATVTELAKAGNTPELMGYLESYQHSIDDDAALFFCENNALNAQLAFYARFAAEEEIDTDWRIALSNDIPISDVDLCTMIGNLLENAIHGCKTVEPKDRYITLSIDIDETGELFVVISNSFDGNAKKQGSRYVSTKHNGSGIGIISVKTTADKYGGIAQFHHTNEEFFADVMLRLSSDSGSP